MTDRMLTVDEAAGVIGCTAVAARKLARTGELPFEQRGSSFVISESALKEALQLKQAQDSDS